MELSFQQQAEAMALRLAHYLLQNSVRLDPETAIPEAVDLIHDWVYHMKRSDLALWFALEFHPSVEHWAVWESWARALTTLLHLERREWSLKEHILLLNYCSQATRELGDYTWAQADAEDALELAQKLEDPDLVAITSNKLGLIALRRGALRVAEEYFLQARSQPHRSLAVKELGHICMNSGVVAVQLNQFADAQRDFEQAIEYYRVARADVFVAKAQSNLADLHHRQGKLIEVPSSLYLAINTFLSTGNLYDYGYAQNSLGCIYLSLKQFDKVVPAFQEAIHTFEQLNALGAKAIVLSNMIDLYLNVDRWEDASVLIPQARSLALSCDNQWLVAIIDVDWGKLLLSQGQREGALQRWQEAAARQRGLGLDKDAFQTEELIKAAQSR